MRLRIETINTETDVTSRIDIYYPSSMPALQDVLRTRVDKQAADLLWRTGRAETTHRGERIVYTLQMQQQEEEEEEED